MNSLWKETTNPPAFPTLKKNIRTDVLIIGGGIAGILTAYLLDKKGVPYVLVEKDRICRGTTCNTTAKITIQHSLIYSQIMKEYGVEKAQMYLKSNQLAFDELTRLCRDTDCEFEEKDNFVYSLTDRKKLEEEMLALQKIGYDARLCESVPLPFKVAGAVSFPKQAQFHPLEFLYKIAENLNIYENTFVREMVGNTAVTSAARITADKVIVTTHFPFINKHGFYFMKLYQHRSYVIALKNAQNVDGMYVDESKTGLSFRSFGELLLLGGGDHHTGKKGGNWNALKGFAAVNYPGAKEMFRWATQDCMSLDGFPYIGQYSKSTPHLFVATGFNKWGMTSAMVSAMLLSEMIFGKKTDFDELYSPSRSMLHPQLFLNGLESIRGLLSFGTKRCPHMGCALKWNSAEHSWDCPCHGSRFDEKGKVIDNPANGDMRR